MVQDTRLFSLAALLIASVLGCAPLESSGSDLSPPPAAGAIPTRTEIMRKAIEDANAGLASEDEAALYGAYVKLLGTNATLCANFYGPPTDGGECQREEEKKVEKALLQKGYDLHQPWSIVAILEGWKTATLSDITTDDVALVQAAALSDKKGPYTEPYRYDVSMATMYSCTLICTSPVHDLRLAVYFAIRAYWKGEPGTFGDVARLYDGLNAHDEALAWAELARRYDAQWKQSFAPPIYPASHEEQVKADSRAKEIQDLLKTSAKSTPPLPAFDEYRKNRTEIATLPSASPIH